MATTVSPMVLPDDLLLEIFLRIGCPADLTRTSAACVAFRHLIADPTFLCRYRSHHAPLLLGFLSSDPTRGFHPVQPPHPNAPAARALDNISFKYLLRERCGDSNTNDVRDGRVLFECDDISEDSLPPYLFVCDPLSRRYIMLPPVPQCGEDEYLDSFNAVFAPSADRNDETSFTVIAILSYFTRLVVFFFDSGSYSWTTCKSYSWDAVGLSSGLEDFRPSFLCPCYAYGCLYWKVYGENKLLKIEINTLELSIVSLPPDHELSRLAVVEVGEGILGMFSLTFGLGDQSLNYYHYNSQIADQWQMKHAIPLPVRADLCIVGAVQGYFFLEHIQLNVMGSPTRTYYSVDINTLKLERIMQISSCIDCCGRPYFGFPSSISSRLI